MMRLDPVPPDWNIETALTVYAELFVEQSVDFSEAVERLHALSNGDLDALRRAREMSLNLQSPPDWTAQQWELYGSSRGEGPEPQFRHRRRVDELLAAVERRLEDRP